jgi:hypothetical protein
MSRVALDRARRDEQMVTAGCRSCAVDSFTLLASASIAKPSRADKGAAQPRMPRIELNPAAKNIDHFKFEDFELLDCDLYPSIKGKIAVYVSF